MMPVFVVRLCTKFEVRRPSRSEDMTHFRSALVGLVTLTFDLLTLKLVHIIARGVDFGVTRTFLSRLIGQHLSDAPGDLATLIFDVEGHDACR